jgi:Fuc2NAc and GlcNAc transferase
MSVIGLMILAGIATAVGVRFLYRRAAAWRMIDVPNARSSHTEPTPRGGGLAMVIVVAATLVLYNAISHAAPWTVLIWYLVGAGLIAAISWLDDRCSLPNSLRLAVHIAGAVLAVLGVSHWPVVRFPLLGDVTLGWLGIGLALVWVVGLINAYNFMDGIDGLAGVQALVAGSGWMIVGLAAGQPVIVGAGGFVAGSSLGFLRYNWSPARIFMGDVGSAFLGYTFAVLPLLVVPAQSWALGCGVLLVWPFIFDSAFTFVRRLCRGERVWQAHRSHLYQRLVIAGASHRRVSYFYGVLAVLGSMAGVLWQYDDTGVSAALAVLYMLCSAAVMYYGTVRYEARTRRTAQTPVASVV